MNTRIKATDYQITPEVSDYLNVRLLTLEKLLGGDADLARCEVELGRDAGNQRHGEHVWFAEITITAPNGMHARATNRAASINAAIDDVKEEVERQLRREKQVHIRILRKGGAALKRLLRFGEEN
ncbi:MAG: HPF/RaiA family ribosome-associated protein [bacterium]|nr:HPF/RaiA family ribosome-associated protein [bacterium]